MVEFNPAILASLILEGYKYIICVPKDGFTLIHPIRYWIPKGIIDDIGYEVKVSSNGAVKMAEGGFTAFRFYMADDILEEREVYWVKK